MAQAYRSIEYSLVFIIFFRTLVEKPFALRQKTDYSHASISLGMYCLRFRPHPMLNSIEWGGFENKTFHSKKTESARNSERQLFLSPMKNYNSVRPMKNYNSVRPAITSMELELESNIHNPDNNVLTEILGVGSRDKALVTVADMGAATNTTTAPAWFI